MNDQGQQNGSAIIHSFSNAQKQSQQALKSFVEPYRTGDELAEKELEFKTRNNRFSVLQSSPKMPGFSHKGHQFRSIDEASMLQCFKMSLKIHTSLAIAKELHYKSVVVIVVERSFRVTAGLCVSDWMRQDAPQVGSLEKTIINVKIIHQVLTVLAYKELSHEWLNLECHVAVSTVEDVLFYLVPLALGKPEGPSAPSESHAEGSALAFGSWLPELVNEPVLLTYSQISQAPAVSDRDLSASTHAGLLCKDFIICRLLPRVATSCGVILSQREPGRVFRTAGNRYTSDLKGSTTMPLLRGSQENCDLREPRFLTSHAAPTDREKETEDDEAESRPSSYRWSYKWNPK
ncbi:PREDICTED: uncharacterized protein LOC105572738 [Cercocebus atys]|uniref:uncharacterized protein LOC105572738 n=1 Tax=Cercocebus atys TaxID=9531 RepID=UPI0005F521BB|nr:PREDICTED: uncharacterized protein LOC105572738 [Cercocebus atys]